MLEVINWEQRRYEIARDVYANMAYRGDDAASFATRDAERLIAELKKDSGSRVHV